MNKYALFLFILVCVSLGEAAAQSVIKGKVYTEENVPLHGCIIGSKHSSSDVSGEDGSFQLTLMQQKDTLTFSYVGYKPVTLAVISDETGFLEVKLTEDSYQIEDIVVSTGYSSLSRERLTGSFEKINEALISRAVSTNLLSRLEGISSLMFDNRGAAPKISLRGRSTIMGNANPLMVVDGFVMEGDWELINPNDVKSVTFLKDAAAASIWGARAGNGVIVIETHKGRFNQKPVLQFTSNFTYGARPDLYYAPSMSSADFIEAESFLFDKGYYNSSLNNARYPVLSPAVEILAAERSGLLTPATAAEKLTTLKNRDVREDLSKYFYRNSFNQQYSLNYRGGSSVYSYNLSAGWDNNQDDLVRNNSNRLSLMSSNTIKPLRRLQIETQIAYVAWVKNRNNNVNSVSPTGKTLYPYASLADEAGNALILEKDHRVAFLDTVGNSRLLDWQYRPLEELRLSNDLQKTQSLRLNTTANYNLIKGLDVEVRYQYESQLTDSKNRFSPESYTARNLVNRFSQIRGNVVFYGIPQGGILNNSMGNLSSHTGRAQLNYNSQLNKNGELHAIAGSEIRTTVQSGNTSRTYGYYDNTLVYGSVNYADFLPTYLNLSGNQKIPNLTDFSGTSYRFVSFYGNVAYSLLRRYSLSLSSRKDASNLFGVKHNQKGVPLWSSGIGWEISKEPQFKSKHFEFLKLRMTYGVSGNVDNTLSALTTVAYYANSPISGYEYAMVNSPGNPDLRWERSAVLNTGLDFSTKNNTVSGSVEYYMRRGNDLIGRSFIDPTTGVNANASFMYTGNVAEMKGSGIDADLRLHLPFSRWIWDSQVILGYTTNRLTKYNAASSSASSFAGNGITITPFEGKPVFAIYSYQWQGLDPLTGDPMGYLEGQNSKNYSAILTADPSTLVYHGSAIPVVFGSFRNTLTYKNWSVSANLMYKLGYYFRRNSINYGGLYSNWIHHPDFANRWKQAGDELITNVPSMIYPNLSNRDNFYNRSEVLVEKADHVRLKDIHINYQSDGFKKRGQTSFYLYLNNLGLLWKANKSNLDPDFFSGGIPPSVAYSLGMKTTF